MAEWAFYVYFWAQVGLTGNFTQTIMDTCTSWRASACTWRAVLEIDLYSVATSELDQSQPGEDACFEHKSETMHV